MAAGPCRLQSDFVTFDLTSSLILLPNLKPQIAQISQIRGETEDGLCNYIFVPNAFLRRITPNSSVSVICEICGSTSFLGFIPCAESDRLGTVCDPVKRRIGQ